MPIQQRYIFCNELGMHTPLDISPQNRAFRYGDGIFETFLVENGQVRSRDAHLERLAKGAKILYFEPEGPDLVQRASAIVEKLLIAQPKDGHARMRIAAFRAPGGNYLPSSNAFQMLGEIHPLPHHPFNLQSPRSLHIAVDYPITPSILSQVKSLNALPYVLAAIKAQKNGCDDALLINHDHDLVELSASNLFVVIDGRVHTPPLQSGCLPGTMRAQTIATIAQHTKNPIIEDPLGILDLSQASEAFCTNAIQGLQPIGEVIGTAYQASKFPVMMQLRKMMGGVQ